MDDNWMDIKLGCNEVMHIIEDRGGHPFDPVTTIIALKTMSINYRALKALR